jgi:peptidyl-prolyl cis-trans isomerase C
MQALLREPLLWFFAAGALLFGLHRALAPGGPATVSRGQAQAALHARLGRAPEAAELAAELEEAAAREALVLEARRLGLADDDPIVKRRLVQKLEALAEALATLDPPDDAALAAQLAAHPERYARPERRTVRQVFLPAPAGEAEAQELLRRLVAGEDPARLGGPFLGGLRFEAHDEAALATRVTGPVARAAFTAPVEAWWGPVASVYGWHLVRVEAVQAGRPGTLAEVGQQLRTDVEVARREAARAALVARARARHPVVVTE